MVRRWASGAWLVALVTLVSSVSSACQTADPAPTAGRLDVLVTLSRSGPVGPSLDRVPQPDERVVAVDADGARHIATTGSNGLACLSLSPGAYAVTAAFCPDGPRSVQVTAETVVDLSINCLAP